MQLPLRSAPDPSASVRSVSASPAVKSTNQNDAGGTDEEEQSIPDNVSDDDHRPVVNRLDPQDKGYDPSTLPRKCTDLCWIFPFFVSLCTYAYILVASVRVGNLEILTTLPDWEGNLCGQGVNKGRPYLYFCMSQESEWIMEANNKSLDVRAPICKEKCPDTWNTSSHCVKDKGTTEFQVMRGMANKTTTWDWIQDYPSSDYLGMLCRPHKAYTERLFWEFEGFMEKAPPTASLSCIFRAPECLGAAFGAAIIFSYVFISLLGVCARCLVWSALLLIFLGNTGVSVFFIYCFKEATCDGIPGKGPSEHRDLALGIATGALALASLFYIRSLGHYLETAGKVIEWSCKCVVKCPSLFVTPLVTLITRVLTLGSLAFLFLNLYTSQLKDDFSETTVMYGPETTWRMVIKLSTIHIVYTVVACLCAFWFQGAITAGSFFIVYYTSQTWYFRGGLGENGGAEYQVLPGCLLLRALWAVYSRHLGSVFLGGFLMTLMQPIQFLLVIFRGMTGSLSIVFGGCCSWADQCYDAIKHISRDALMDVSLQGMPFQEAGNHAAESLASIEELGVLNGITWVFQFAGIGATSVVGYFTVLFFICCSPRFHDPESPDYIERPFLMCAAGAAIALVTAFPFMMLFDNVADSVLFSRHIERQRRRPSEKDMARSSCTPSSWKFLKDVAGCHCGARGAKNTSGTQLPENSPFAAAYSPVTDVAYSPTAGSPERTPRH